MRQLLTTPPLLAAALTLSTAALAQRSVIVVRHAEKISDSDERLSEAGGARAERLAAMLKDAGAGAGYSTETERTIGTVTALKFTSLSKRESDWPPLS